MKNLKIIKSKEADNFFKRNKNYYQDLNDELKPDLKRWKDLVNTTKIKAKNILEIGCADGNKIFQYKRLLKAQNACGVDLSSQAINYGKKKYKGVKLLKLSSLEINKIKINFDLIICGFFLYHLDREDIFKQFEIIYKKLNKNGLLIIEDFDPLFKHTNQNKHNKSVHSFKMSYDKFLEESGLFKIIYKNKYNYPIFITRDKKKFKSNDVSLTLFKKIDFKNNYPENI